MVSIEKKDGNFIFEIKGIHKLWALRSQLTIPIEHVRSARLNENSTDLSDSWRMPGTRIPGIITAGTFLVDNGTIFCDITDNKNSIIVELQDEVYSKLIIEVEDTKQALALLSSN